MSRRPTKAAKSRPTGGKTLLSGQIWINPLAIALLAIGTISRLIPLADPYGRLLRQFMSEDGYLMQTVARNLALGHGLSVSDGTIQTNGVQPLATFVFSVFYVLSGGSKVGGVAGVQLFSALVALGAAALFYALAKRMLANHPDGPPLALLTAALWFASPLIVKHSMNGLETGLYFLVSIATLYLFAHFSEASPTRLGAGEMVALGCMFGLCFLARNDAIFLIAGILLSRFVLSWPRNMREWQNRIVEAAVPGLISLAIAAPWLIYNYRLFGSIMPISGISESLYAVFGSNLSLVPAKLFEFVALIAPIPDSLETKWVTIVLCVAVTGVAIAYGYKPLWRASQTARLVLSAYAIFGVLLVAFYGLYFGAAYFMARYMSILSPGLVLVGVVAVYRLLTSMKNGWVRRLLAPAAAALALWVLFLNGIFYRHGLQHEHFQVVDWVRQHVPAQSWVGAPQSGTLGFYHDRTINLDGKVNPDALRAKLDGDNVIGYVVNSNITYLADWAGLAVWAKIEKDGFNKKFKLIVHDNNNNLAVFQRLAPRGGPH